MNQPSPIPPILLEHPLRTLIDRELSRANPRPGYFLGLAVPEPDLRVRHALLELARALDPGTPPFP